MEAFGTREKKKGDCGDQKRGILGIGRENCHQGAPLTFAKKARQKVGVRGGKGPRKKTQAARRENMSGDSARIARKAYVKWNPSLLVKGRPSADGGGGGGVATPFLQCDPNWKEKKIYARPTN